MRVPGTNLLKKAMRIIGNQVVTYLQFTGRISNAPGKYVPSFAAPVSIRCSFQPIDRGVYEDMGLDFQKQYWMLYAPQSLIDIQRDVSGDRVIYNGFTYQCESATAWASIDGWTQMLCVKILPVSGGN